MTYILKLLRAINKREQVVNLDQIMIFIVNLKGSVERKLHMQNLLKSVGLSAIFIEAIDGRLLSDELLNQYYDKEASLNSIGRELSANEVGCALSHIEIYKKITQDSIGISLVLEDDIVFGEDLLQVLAQCKLLPNDWGLVFLGHHGEISRDAATLCSLWGGEPLTQNYKLRRPVERVSGTYGYLISRNGAENLLKLSYCISKPIDHYTGNSKLVNLYVIKPPVIRVDDYLSENYHSMADRELMLRQANFSWYKRLAIRLKLYKLLAYSLYLIKAPILIIRPLKRYKKTL